MFFNIIFVLNYSQEKVVAVREVEGNELSDQLSVDRIHALSQKISICINPEEAGSNPDARLNNMNNKKTKVRSKRISKTSN